MDSFSVEIPFNDPEAMEQFQEMMDSVHDSYGEEIENIRTTLGLSDACAMDVFYLRSRSRWTQELEDQLIALHRAGNPPNIMEFGCA